MAAAAGMASSFFSSSIKSLRSKNNSTFLDPLTTTSSNNRILLAPSVSHSYSYSLQPLSIRTISHKLWVPTISVAVAHEEVITTAEEKVVDQQEVKEEEVVAEETTVSTTATKLYFGNLPYSVDSAQLAGLIEDYGSAELIEVCFYNFFNYQYQYQYFLHLFNILSYASLQFISISLV